MISKSKWQEIAKKAGMSTESIKDVEIKKSKNRNSLIQSEYDYVVGSYGIFDMSPSYVWENMKINAINEIAVFQDLKFSQQESCSK